METGSSPVELFCHSLDLYTNDPFEGRGAQTVDLRRTTALSPSGIYRCDIAFDSDDPLAREIFYVGVYANGGTNEY